MGQVRVTAVVLDDLPNQRSLGMPDGEAGAQLGREGEEIERHTELAMIALFGFLETMKMELLAKRGRPVDARMDGYLAKPYRPQELFETVERMASGNGEDAALPVPSRSDRGDSLLAGGAAEEDRRLLRALAVSGFAAANTTILEVAPAYGPLHSEILGDTFVMRDGFVYPPQTPGLGIQLSEETRQRFPFVPGSGEYNSVPGKILPEELERRRHAKHPG